MLVCSVFVRVPATSPVFFHTLSRYILEALRKKKYNSTMSQPNKNRTRANCLRKYRKARGLALTDVAAILGLKSTSTLSRWENGVSLPDTVNALRLSILYRTFVDALFINLAQDIKVDLRKAERLVLTDEARRGAAKRGADYRFDSKSK